MGAISSSHISGDIEMGIKNSVSTLCSSIWNSRVSSGSRSLEETKLASPTNKAKGKNVE